MIRPSTSGETVNKIDVLIVANYAATDGSRNCRFGDIASRLTDLGANVELATSNFEHDDHSFRIDPLIPEKYQLTLIHETGYSKNISLKRLKSQYTFARNLGKYLEARPAIPDLIYCAVPSPDAARQCAEYAQQHDIPFVVDIQDLWPEAFGMRFQTPGLIKLLFRGMTKASRIAYQQADLVLGVSQTYVSHAEQLVGRSLPTSVVFLGTSLGAIDQDSDTVPEVKETHTTGRIAYAGTLSHSYDLPMVIDALALLATEDQRFQTLELMVLGDGPLRTQFEDYAQQKPVRVTFTGRLPYSQMLNQLRAADIAVNPIVAGSAGSVLNKVGDYAAAGLPVVNTQESEEYRKLIQHYDAGINCETGNTNDVAAAIRRLIDNPTDRNRMGQNNRRMAEELFDRDTTYAQLVKTIWDLAHRDSATKNQPLQN